MEKIKCKVVMLPTKDVIPNIILFRTDRDMKLFDEQFYNIYKTHQQFGQFHPVNATFQHLYLISDREIKEGDWYLVNQYGNGLLCSTKPATKEDLLYKDKFECHIIEATTNPSLNLPPIPQSFIEEYVEKQGKIDEVWVEIDVFDCTANGEVIISLIEEKLYTRDEVISLVISAIQYRQTHILIDKWIKENL